jgi:hypothetical protein
LKANTAAPFVLSYADTTHGHHGGIYQALNFKYVGQSESSHIGFTATDGSFIHGRVCNTRFNTSSIEKIRRIKPLWEPAFGKPKHLYIYPIKSKWRLIQEARGWRDMPYPKPDLVADEARSFVGAAA